MSRRSNWSFSAAYTALSVAIALCLGASPTHAGDAVLTWTLATQNTDGTAIPASGPTSLASTRVEWGSCSGSNFGTKAGEQVVAKPAVTYTVTGLAPGTWCFRAYSRNTYGAESDPTNVVSKVIAPPTPQPPGTLTVTVQTVYQVIGTANAFALIPVGNAPAGTQCDTTQSILGRYVVPRESVTWYGSVRPQAVVADCS